MAGSSKRISFFWLILILSGCRGDLISEQTELPLQGTTWTLNHIDIAGNVSEPPGNETYTILFDTVGVLSGQSNCNICRGSYHVRKSDTLVLSLACTEAGCGPSGSSLGHFPVYASGVFGYHISESRLTLQKRQFEGSLALVFDGQ